MKTFSKFREENNLVSEGILRNFANWIAGLGKNITDKVNEFQKDIEDFPTIIQNSFKGLLANSGKDGDPIKKEVQEKILINIKDPKNVHKQIAKLFDEKKDDKDFMNSQFAASLCAFGINMAKQNNDSEVEKSLTDTLNKFNSKAKEKAADIIKDIAKENPPKEGEEGGEGKDEKTEKIEQTITDTVNKEKDTIESSGISANKLSGEIFKIIKTINADKGDDIDLDDVSTLSDGLAKIYLGLSKIEDVKELTQDILTKYGITDINKFKEEVSKTIKK